jgi:hypothetical protein
MNVDTSEETTVLVKGGILEKAASVIPAKPTSFQPEF